MYIFITVSDRIYTFYGTRWNQLPSSISKPFTASLPIYLENPL